jgi:hypothetical protein
MQSVLIRTIFYLCENAQNSHNFCSIWVLFFVLWKIISMAIFPWKFISWLRPLQYNSGDAIRTIRAYTWPSWHLLLHCRGHSQLIQIFIGRWSWMLSCTEKNRTQIEKKVWEIWVFSQKKMQKRVVFSHNCINGLIRDIYCISARLYVVRYNIKIVREGTINRYWAQLGCIYPGTV